MTTNLRHAFGGIWRLTARRFLAAGHLLSLLGVSAVLALILFAYLHSVHGPELYLGFTVGFYFTFLVPLMAFLSGSGAVRDDLKVGSADYLFTRPLARPIHLVFRYAAHLVFAQLDFALALAVVVAAGWLRHVPEIGAAIPAMALAQALAVAAFSAFGFFCAVISPRFHVVLGLIYGVVVEKGFGNIPIQINRLSMTHQIGLLLRPAMSAGDVMPLTGSALAGRLGILAVFTVVMLLAAAGIFGRQELVTGARADG